MRRKLRFAHRVPDLLQPESMKTAQYQYGIDSVDGNLAWSLFCASGSGDSARVRELLAQDPRLVNAQYWYQFPIHMAVREGHTEIVRLLLEADADPGQSRYTYNSWDKLLDIAQERAFDEIVALLSGTMQKRFGFEPAFALVVEATKARNLARVEELLTENPAFIHAADALGNGTLHWAALTRQNDLIDVLVDRGAALEPAAPMARPPCW